MVHEAIIPARFLSLTAHLVLNIMLFWSRVSPNKCILHFALAEIIVPIEKLIVSVSMTTYVYSI